MDVGNRGYSHHPTENKRCQCNGQCFVDQYQRFLQLSYEEHTNISAEEPDFPKSARVLFEYGVEKEGYWTGDIFMKNVECGEDCRAYLSTCQPYNCMAL